MSLNINKRYLTLGKKCRPGKHLTDVRGFVVHWIGAGQKSATVIRNNFENADINASTQFIIGYEGEIIQCMDETELAYQVGANKYTNLKYKVCGNYNPNNYMIGVECCTNPSDCYLINGMVPMDYADMNKYPKMGALGPKLYASLVELGAYICKKYNLDPWTQIFTHADFVGKNYKSCHVWFVNHPEDFNQYKQDVVNKLNGIEIPPVPVVPDYANISIEKANRKGILVGDGSGNLMLTNHVTRQDLAVFFDKLHLLGDKIPDMKFTSTNNESVPSKYAEDAVKKAYGNKIIAGNETTLLLHTGITRQDLFCIFDRLNLLGNNPAEPILFKQETGKDNMPSNYAKTSVAKSIYTELIRGDNTGDYRLRSIVERYDLMVFFDRLNLLD